MRTTGNVPGVADDPIDKCLDDPSVSLVSRRASLAISLMLQEVNAEGMPEASVVGKRRSVDINVITSGSIFMDDDDFV